MIFKLVVLAVVIQLALCGGYGFQGGFNQGGGGYGSGGFQGGFQAPYNEPVSSYGHQNNYQPPPPPPPPMPEPEPEPMMPPPPMRSSYGRPKGYGGY